MKIDYEILKKKQQKNQTQPSFFFDKFETHASLS